MRFSTSAAVTPSNTADISLGTAYDCLYVGGAGTVAALLADGSTWQSTASIAAATFLPIAVKRVLVTGTTATAMYALKH